MSSTFIKPQDTPLQDTLLTNARIIDPESGSADKKRTSRIHQHALKNGLIMITAGTYGNIIRTLMPLTIKEDELNQSLEILSDALKNA